MKTIKKHIDDACVAHAHLNVFAAVIGALENGTIQGGGSADATAQKIIKLCNAENQRQWQAMNKAIEAANGIKGNA